MSLENKDYYKILQVDPSADPEVIAVAYKRLARKYHPDTNKSPDATLRMQEINTAYQVLRDPVKRAQYDRERSSHSSRSDARNEEERRKREEAEAAWRRAKEEAEAAQHCAEEERRKQEEAEAAQRHTKEPQLWWGLPGWVFSLSLLGVLVIFGWLSTQVRHTQQVPPLPLVRYDVSVPTKPDYQQGSASQTAKTQTQTAEYEQSRSQGMKDIATDPSIEHTQSAAQTNQDVQSESSVKQTKPAGPTRITQTTPSQPSIILKGDNAPDTVVPSLLPQQRRNPLLDYGPTKEVLAQREAIKNAPPAPHDLSQRTEPSRSQHRGDLASAPEFFTLGSTWDEALKVQGTPDHFTHNSLHYGTSDVFFKNGRVVSWYNGYPKLKVHLSPSTPTSKNFFTSGSTKDEVLALQGTPDRLTNNSFHYGTSDVYFQNGRIARWYNGHPKLNVRLEPTTPTTKSFFTVGSTKDEVLAIQGTPDKFTEDSFHYGTSDVYFQNGRIARWYNGYPKLKVVLNPGQ